VLASALAMNKPLANKLFRSAGLLVPQGEVIEFANRNKPRRVKLPAVVKPVDGGSSVGVSIVWNNNELVPAIKRAFKYSENILIEEYITGREVTCGVLYEQGEAIALPPTEIIPKSGFFDYDAKYIPGKTEEITPARFPKRVLHAIQETALSAHNALQCGGMSRTDMIVQILNIKNQKSKIRNPARLRMYDLPAMTSSLRSQAGVQAGGQIPKIYVLEINTIPGMTKTSLLPQAAEAAGISFSKMLDMIVLSAIKTKVN